MRLSIKLENKLGDDKMKKDKNFPKTKIIKGDNFFEFEDDPFIFMCDGCYKAYEVEDLGKNDDTRNVCKSCYGTVFETCPTCFSLTYIHDSNY